MGSILHILWLPKGRYRFDPATTLCRSDITLHTSSACLLIKASKTDPFRQTCVITIGATPTSTCLVAALQKYTTLTSALFVSSPLHISGQYMYFLIRQHLTSHLHTLLQLAGFDPDAYASYSLCIGATTAAAAGLPDWQIQAMGRWSSYCYTHYICTPQSTPAQTSRRLTSHNHTSVQ